MIRTLATALATTTCIVALATPAAAQTRDYNIPAGSLKSALDAYARQSGRQVIYRGDEVRSARSPGARGSLSADAALDALLAGTGFVVKADSTGALAIVKAGNGQDRAERVSSMGEDEGSEGEEIIVTGTIIRGAAPASNVITLRREDIRRSGVSTARDLLLTLPQNFGGGINENTVIAPGGNTDNGYAASANLRGLGSNATLVLLDGRRLAPAGIGGAVDISSIPLPAVARVEVLTDGASATYGSDAVGGVVNFITRERFSGAITEAELGSDLRGDVSEARLAQTFGREWSTGSILAAGEYYERSALKAGDRAFSYRLPDGHFITPDQHRWSGFLRGRQDVGDIVSLHGSFLYSDQRKVVSDLLQPFRNIADNRQIAANFGVEVDAGGWRVAVDGTYGKADQDKVTESPLYPTGVNLSGGDNTTYGIDARIDGALFNFGSAAVRLAAGGSYRKEEFRSLNPVLSADRDVYSAFGELLIPLVSSTERELTISLAGRYEHYSDFGDSVDPKVGIVWRPVSALRFRGTWSTSFHAPQFFDLYSANTAIVVRVPDPQSPSGTLAMFGAGGNPNLTPERSETFTVGVDFAPKSWSGFRASLTYFDTSYTDRIATAYSNPFAVLTNESLYGPAVVIRNPPANLIDEFLSRATELSLVGPYNRSDLGAFVAGYKLNISSTDVRGIDLQINKDWTVPGGTVGISANATYLLENSRIVTPGAARESVLNTVFNTPEFRTRVGVSWTGEMLSSAVFFNYTSPYDDTTIIPAGNVGSYATVDLSADFNLEKMSAGAGFLRGFTIGLVARNLFNEAPPGVAGSTGFFASAAYGYDPTNADPIGRFVSIRLRKSW